MTNTASSVSKSFFWKLMERFGVSIVQFILQIILARLLSPDHYGVLSIMIIFTTLATVFVQNGFNMALIQGKDVNEEDYSSVFWVSLFVALLLYIALFFASPLIADFYDMPSLITPFRVLALMLFPGALNSVQLAKVSREMKFRKVFVSNIGAVLVSGVVGVALAYAGGGLWALVAQSLLNVVVACVVMCFTVNLRLRFICNVKRVKKLFGYGWKLLVSALIETLYQDLRSLVIGKKYNSSMLGYYNRGKQFPQFINNAVNGTVQSVMLPAMSVQQDDKRAVKTMMRTSMRMSAFVMFPIMFGLAAVATPLVSILLTEKWLECVPFMQIYCFTFAFYPVHSCNLQAINAIGRSDVFLKLEIIKKIYGITALVIAILCFNSPVAIAMTGLITTLISWIINAFPNKKLIKYSFSEQIKDLFPYIILSLIMGGVVYSLSLLEISNLLMLLFQVVSGAIIYIAFSALFKISEFYKLLNMIKKAFTKRKKEKKEEQSFEKTTESNKTEIMPKEDKNNEEN